MGFQRRPILNSAQRVLNDMSFNGVKHNGLLPRCEAAKMAFLKTDLKRWPNPNIAILRNPLPLSGEGGLSENSFGKMA